MTTAAAGAVQNWAGSENATLAEGLSQLGLVGSSGQISDIVVNMLAGVGDMISASSIITFFLIFMTSKPPYSLPALSAHGPAVEAPNWLKSGSKSKRASTPT